MKTLEIKAAARTAFGKKEAKKLHREEMAPATISGNGETKHFSVVVKDLKPLIYSPNSYIVEIDIDGQKETAVMREVQFHPVREQVLHIDFFRAVAGKEVMIDLPVVLVGNSVGVKVGGKLMQGKRKLTVKGMLDKMPDELTVDVTELELGKSVFVGDLSFDGLQILTPATTAVAAVKMTRAARGAAAAAEAAK